jgi:hypothetical protein
MIIILIVIIIIISKNLTLKISSESLGQRFAIKLLAEVTKTF